MPRHRVSSLLATLVVLACASAAVSTAASAAPSALGGRPTRLEVWDLQLGTQIETLPDEFIDYACGTNGGAPSVPLTGWRDAGRCRPEPSGLREVYFRYDDELEFWAKANNLLTQMAQTQACSRHHSIDQQFCRWLLLSLDRLPSSKMKMTQDEIANLLGVRREGVTVAAGRLQKAGLIEYARGRIAVLDRPGLERQACECYQVVKREFDRLLPDVMAS